MSRIIARRRKASAVRARFSTSLARRRQRFKQLKVRSAIRRRGRALVAAVGEDPLDEWEQPARLLEHGQAAVAVLDVGGMDARAQQQTERVDQDVALASLDLLARVVARRVGARPPFSALLTLWLSRIAALGLASLPACSRAWT